MYTDEKNVTLLVSLLKNHGICDIIASPGSANSPFVTAVQKDVSFNVYSVVDERSAAYLACGLSHETNKPVVLSCTGATASRNYLSGLTEAYYRKLPILAITSTKAIGRVGHHIAQVIDRSVLPKDTIKLSVTLPIIKDSDDEWECHIKTNQAILELSRQGGGPVHINLQTNSSKSYKTKNLPKSVTIKRYTNIDQLPEIDKKNIAIYVGSHKKWKKEEVSQIEKFCINSGAAVFCDHTSGYNGINRIQISLLASQVQLNKSKIKPDLIIYIGEISGDYALLGLTGPEVWRVNIDGELRDTFGNLTSIFQMEEQYFFEKYERTKHYSNFYNDCKILYESVYKNIPDLPLSNIYVAHILSKKIPCGSAIHFSILNSLRSWNLFETTNGTETISNVGGFGIDGCLSSLVGASLSNKEKLYFGIIGDLSFFYDLNVLGNRHVGKNLRILLINNGLGAEFRQYKHHTSHFGDTANKYICAQGHFGNQSPRLVKDYAENLGFKYLSAKTKDEFLKNQKEFTQSGTIKQSIVFEIFTEQENESKAYEIISNIYKDTLEITKGTVKEVVGNVLGKKGKNFLKKRLKNL